MYTHLPENSNSDLLMWITVLKSPLTYSNMELLVVLSVIVDRLAPFVISLPGYSNFSNANARLSTQGFRVGPILPVRFFKSAKNDALD
jgi:hypothetical protein